MQNRKSGKPFQTGVEKDIFLRKHSYVRKLLSQVLFPVPSTSKLLVFQKFFRKLQTKGERRPKYSFVIV